MSDSNTCCRYDNLWEEELLYDFRVYDLGSAKSYDHPSACSASLAIINSGLIDLSNVKSTSLHHLRASFGRCRLSY
jgi:hypothetical protein